MLKNYFKIALRNIYKNKVVSFLNISGLAIGIASSLLILIFLQYELSYDKFHSDSEKIFRVLTLDNSLGVSSSEVGISFPPLAPTIGEKIPEIIDYTRFRPSGKSLLKFNDKTLFAENLYTVENSFLNFFSFEVIQGDKNELLKKPNELMLSETLAKKLFGNEPAVGKSVILDGGETPQEVTGIFKDFPKNSHLQADAMSSMVPSADQQGYIRYLVSWNSISMVQYIKLTDPSQSQEVLEKMISIIRENDVEERFSLTVQPLEDVHLKSTNVLFEAYNRNKGEISYIYTLSAVALLIIIIASINFMNLATAKSIGRAKEIGVRKVVGANKKQLMFQQIGESTLLCFISGAFAFGLLAIAGKFFQTPSGVTLSLGLIQDPMVFVYIFGGILGLGILSGLYPAFVLTAFKPVNVLKGSFKTSSSGINVRRGLLIWQFATSIAMIIGTGVVKEQIDFIKNMDTGYDREQVMTFNMGNPELQRGLQTFRDKLDSYSAIVSTGLSSSMPGRGFGRNSAVPEGFDNDKEWILSVFNIDDRYLETMNMDILEGRNFSNSIASDTGNVMLINETAAKEIGWTPSAIGKTLTFGATSDNPQVVNVIGVVKDFNYATVRHKIEPLMFFYQPNSDRTLSLKLNTENLEETIAYFEESWAELFPTQPFEYSFLDEEFEASFQGEKDFENIMNKFTILAIFVACLGLFGLAAFTEEQKTKEFGIRKTLGASQQNLFMLMTTDFLKWIALSSILAWPLGYYAMNEWLGQFIYKVDMPLYVFGISTALVMLIALATVSYQAVKASVKNPAHSLRYE